MPRHFFPKDQPLTHTSHWEEEYDFHPGNYLVYKVAESPTEEESLPKSPYKGNIYCYLNEDGWQYLINIEKGSNPLKGRLSDLEGGDQLIEILESQPNDPKTPVKLDETVQSQVMHMIFNCFFESLCLSTEKIHMGKLPLKFLDDSWARTLEKVMDQPKTQVKEIKFWSADVRKKEDAPQFSDEQWATTCKAIKKNGKLTTFQIWGIDNPKQHLLDRGILRDNSKAQEIAIGIATAYHSKVLTDLEKESQGSEKEEEAVSAKLQGIVDHLSSIEDKFYNKGEQALDDRLTKFLSKYYQTTPGYEIDQIVMLFPELIEMLSDPYSSHISHHGFFESGKGKTEKEKNNIIFQFAHALFTSEDVSCFEEKEKHQFILILLKELIREKEDNVIEIQKIIQTCINYLLRNEDWEKSPEEYLHKDKIVSYQEFLGAARAAFLSLDEPSDEEENWRENELVIALTKDEFNKNDELRAFQSGKNDYKYNNVIVNTLMTFPLVQQRLVKQFGTSNIAIFEDIILNSEQYPLPEGCYTASKQVESTWKEFTENLFKYLQKFCDKYSEELAEGKEDSKQEVNLGVVLPRSGS